MWFCPVYLFLLILNGLYFHMQCTHIAECLIWARISQWYNGGLHIACLFYACAHINNAHQNMHIATTANVPNDRTPGKNIKQQKEKLICLF